MTDPALSDPAPGMPAGVVPILSASNFVIGMGAFMVIGMLGPMAEDLQVSASGAGWLMTVYALSVALSSPILVAVTGRIGRRRVMAAGLALFAAASLLAALSPGLDLLLVARALAAMGAGIVTPVAAAVVAGLSPPERRARSLAAVFAGITIAQVVGVPLGSFMAYTLGWRSAFLLVALLALPCVWLIWTRVPAGLSFPAARLSDLGAMLRHGRVMLSVSFTAIFLAAIYVVYTYFSPLLTEFMGFGRDGISAALLIFGLGAVLGNLIGGAMSDRMGTERTLLILGVAQAVLLPVFSLLPIAMIPLFVFILVWSAAGWSFTAPQQARLFAISPENAGVLLALNAAAIYVGAALGSAFGGLVLDSLGLAALGVAGGAVAVLSVVTLVLARRPG